VLCRLLRARTEHSGVVWTSRSVFGCIMIYATHHTRKLTRKDDKLASHARFITQECCRSAQRPGRRLRALQVVVTLNCTDNLPPSVIYTITRLGRAGNTAERAGTNVEGDHNRQQRVKAPKAAAERTKAAPQTAGSLHSDSFLQSSQEGMPRVLGLCRPRLCAQQPCALRQSRRARYIPGPCRRQSNGSCHEIRHD